ncbi:MAG: hypothetical protein M3O30_09550 [Planctomycetota bacterium]|nr:hypothetical protein [Planctomycetota bacterium]
MSILTLFRKFTASAAAERRAAGGSVPRTLSKELLVAITGASEMPSSDNGKRGESWRVPIGTRAFIRVPREDPRAISIVVRDISAVGVSLHYEKAMKPGQQFCLYLHKAESSDETVGIVCAAASSDRGGAFRELYVISATFIEGEPPVLSLQQLNQGDNTEPNRHEEGGHASGRAAPMVRLGSSIFQRASAGVSDIESETIDLSAGALPTATSPTPLPAANTDKKIPETIEEVGSNLGTASQPKTGAVASIEAKSTVETAEGMLVATAGEAKGLSGSVPETAPGSAAKAPDEVALPPSIFLQAPRPAVSAAPLPVAAETMIDGDDTVGPAPQEGTITPIVASQSAAPGPFIVPPVIVPPVQITPAAKSIAAPVATPSDDTVATQSNVDAGPEQQSAKTTNRPQRDRVARALNRQLSYLNRFLKRMDQELVPPTDAVYVRTVQARRAIESLVNQLAAPVIDGKTAVSIESKNKQALRRKQSDAKRKSDSDQQNPETESAVSVTLNYYPGHYLMN